MSTTEEPVAEPSEHEAADTPIDSQDSSATAAPAPTTAPAPSAEQPDAADTTANEQEGDTAADKEEPEQQQEQEQQEDEAAGAAAEEDTADAPAAEKPKAHTYSHKHTTASRAATTMSPGRTTRTKLTFTGPPNAGMAKPYTRTDYSHSQTKLLKIAHDNEVLVKKLTDISRQAPGWVAKASEPPSATAALATGANASAAVNRRKAAASIAQENHALYQRLVAIKPSKDISRETLNREHALNLEYGRRASNYKPGQVRATSSSPGRR